LATNATDAQFDTSNQHIPNNLKQIENAPAR
jgi:hypothetical protein